MTTGPDVPVDSVLLIGFGGPTEADQVLPFLRRVTHGRGVPEERLAEVERHYREVGGRSPYNDLTFRQAGALERWLSRSGRPLPVHVGMRNSDPLLADVLRGMDRAGLRHAAGVILAAHRSESSWERYQRDVERAREEIGTGPAVSFLGACFESPGFLEAAVGRIEEAGGSQRGEWPAGVKLVFTAHSIPVEMARRSTYVQDLEASCRGVAARLGVQDWTLAYQSRSGEAGVPWLEPDINDLIRGVAARGTRSLIVAPIGFLIDHVEVLYDLDIEARRTAAEAGLSFRRAACVGEHPAFIAAVGTAVLDVAGPGTRRIGR